MRTDLKVKLDTHWEKRTGRAAAITRMCIQCIYDPDAMGTGTWRQQVANCTATKCGLYKYRPTTTAQD